MVGVAGVVWRGEGLVEALLAAAPAGHRAAAGGGAVPAENIKVKQKYLHLEQVHACKVVKQEYHRKKYFKFKKQIFEFESKNI